MRKKFLLVALFLVSMVCLSCKNDVPVVNEVEVVNTTTNVILINGLITRSQESVWVVVPCLLTLEDESSGEYNERPIGKLSGYRIIISDHLVVDYERL